MFNLRKALISAGVCFVFLSLFAVMAFAEGNGVGIVGGDGLNIRKSPSTSSEVLEQLQKGTQVSILSSTDGWYKVEYNEIVGWVSSDYLTVKQVESKSGTILADDVNLRSDPTTDAKVLTTLDKGSKVSVYSSSGNWYKVKISDGTVGWIFTDFISVKGNTSRGSEELAAQVKVPEVKVTPPETKKETDTVKDTTKDTTVTQTAGQNIVTYAKKFLGVRYVYGASSPSGFDCSGFTKYVYSHFGVGLERVAADQAKHGTKVSRDNLKPGDLVFFDTNGGHNYINHAGIYIGGGSFIHASSGRSKRKVVISSLNESFYANTYMTARRMLK